MRAKNEFKFIAETYEQVLKENAEGDWAKNTPAGREDGNEPNNRNILGFNWTKLDPETHKMLSMAEDLLGNLDEKGYGELAQRGISGVDDNYDDGAVNMLYNLIDQGWTRDSKAWKLSRKIVDFGLDGLDKSVEQLGLASLLASEDNEYGYRETMPMDPPEREYHGEDPYYDPVDDDAREQARRDDDDIEKWQGPEFPALRQKDEFKDSVRRLDDEIVALQKSSEGDSSKRMKEFNRRIAQIKQDFKKK
tara:strand:+ start:149 stop:895 length:747 start_codon:yes stop_codon:yes gene_type:complete